MKRKAIIFDWDGTLVDMFDQTLAAFNAALIATGRTPWDRETGMKYIGQPDNLLFPQLFGEDAEKAFAVYIAKHKEMEKAQGNNPPPTLAGANELIAYLREQKSSTYVGIVSNKPKQLIEHELKTLGWDGVFDSIIGAGDAPENKPSVKAMEAVLNDMPQRCSLKNVLYIGDSNTDRDFARACECQLMIVGNKVREGLDVGEQVESLPEVQERLQRILRSKKHARISHIPSPLTP
jgi:phosphoglycolate phosphatase